MMHAISTHLLWSLCFALAKLHFVVVRYLICYCKYLKIIYYVFRLGWFASGDSTMYIWMFVSSLLTGWVAGRTPFQCLVASYCCCLFVFPFPVYFEQCCIFLYVYKSKPPTSIKIIMETKTSSTYKLLFSKKSKIRENKLIPIK